MENEYQMKVNLECGEEEEHIIVIMGCYDYCDTDITIVDFMNAKDELEYLLPKNSKEKLKVFVSDNIKNETLEESSDE